MGEEILPGHVTETDWQREDGDFDMAFASLGQLRAGGLLLGSDPLFSGRGHSIQLSALAARHALPAISEVREFAAAN